MQDHSGLNGCENVMYARLGRVSVSDQSHSLDCPSKSNTAPSKLIETGLPESTCRIETVACTSETSVTTACDIPKVAESVDTVSRIVGSEDSMVPLRIDAAFSHEILIFLLWVKSLGFDRALIFAKALPSPWPETLAAYEVDVICGR